jgi:acyl-CoA thioesterase
LALQPCGAGQFRAHTSEDYWNMAGPFGGVTAALLLRAALQAFGQGLEPVSLTVNFCAPMAPGPLMLQATELRRGKLVLHGLVLLRTADDLVVASATVVLALRQHTFEHLCAAMPQVKPAVALPSMADDPRFAWLQQYEFRFAEGAPDLAAGAAAGAAASKFWVHDRIPRQLDWLSLAAYCDFFFLRIFHLRQSLTVAGTVSMSAIFHAHPTELDRQGTSYLLGCADASVFSRNFFDQRAELWSADGTLLATSTQVAWFES